MIIFAFPIPISDISDIKNRDISTCVRLTEKVNIQFRESEQSEIEESEIIVIIQSINFIYHAQEKYKSNTITKNSFLEIYCIN